MPGAKSAMIALALALKPSMTCVQRATATTAGKTSMSARLCLTCARTAGVGTQWGPTRAAATKDTLWTRMESSALVRCPMLGPPLPSYVVSNLGYRGNNIVFIIKKSQK